MHVSCRPIDILERKARERFELSRLIWPPRSFSLINKLFCVPARDIRENMETYFKFESVLLSYFLE